MKKKSCLMLVVILAMLQIVAVFAVVPASAASTVSSTELSIPNGKQAVYECKINYKSGETSSVKLGNTEIFSISNSGIKLCNAAVSGVYGVGEYSVKAYINPTQKMVCVEVTLLDGGVLRRGTYEMLGGNIVNVLSPKADNVSGVQVNYVDITVKNYQAVGVEPTYTGFQSNVYNLVTSFDDACTTRNFAWTAKASFVGNFAMAIKYRVDGTDEWTTVDAVKAVENTAIASEDYFKAELRNLSPDTEYEYKIGKKNSSDEKNDWSHSYYFTTAKENVTDFSFVAIGDTQALSWNGDTPSGRGAKYTELAIRAAMHSVEDLPAFILHTGDVVNSASYLNHWNWYFKALGNYGAVIPQFTAIGNHDTLTDNQNNYFSLHFNHPDNGADAIDKTIAGQVTTNYAQVLVNNPEETVYSYNYGDVHFIVLNSGTYSKDDQYIIKAQREWLIRDLEANRDAKWTILMVHEAVYHKHLSSESRPWLSDVIEDYGVDLVLQGHSHLVTRTYPMKGGAIVTKQNPDVITKGSGTVYTTIGSTATNHDPLGNPNMEEMLTIITPDIQQPAYTVVSVEGNKLTMTVKQANGLVLDTFMIVSEDNSNSLGGDQEDETGDQNDAPNGALTPNAPVESEQLQSGQTTGGGCASVVNLSASVAMIVTIGAGFLTQKKKTRKKSKI